MEKTATQWLRPGTYSLLNRVSIVGIASINVFIMVRQFAPKEVGVWVLFTSIGGIFETLRNGFIRNPFVSKLVLSDIEDSPKIVKSSFYLHVLLALFLAFLLALGAGHLSDFWNQPDLKNLFYIYSINTLALIPFFHFEYLLQSKLQFKAIFLSNLFKQSFITMYLLLYMLMNWNPSLYDLAILQVIATGLASVFYYYVGYSYLKEFNFSNSKPSFIKDLFQMGKYTFGTNISSMLIKNTDSWMIGRLLSSTAVAMYNPAIRIANIIEVPTLALASVAFPQVGTRMKEAGISGVQSVYYKSVSLILAIMLPVIIPIYFLSDYIILFLFGDQYLDASPILRITIFYTFIIPFNRQFGTIMDGLGTPKLNFYLLIAVAVLNIIFNYFFLNAYGIIGAAYGTVLAYFFVFIANQAILFFKFRIKTFVVLVEVINWYVKGLRFLLSKF